MNLNQLSKQTDNNKQTNFFYLQKYNIFLSLTSLCKLIFLIVRFNIFISFTIQVSLTTHHNSTS